MRISDWSSDVCSSDPPGRHRGRGVRPAGRCAGRGVHLAHRQGGSPRLRREARAELGERMSATGTEVRIDAPRGALPAYVAEPDGDSAAPAVVVIHDAFGMTTDLRNQVDWLAGEGYLAAGPDLFHWGGKLRCIRTVMSEIRDGAGRSFDEVEAVRSWLTAHPR